jgi:hypothetical protein
MLEQSMDDLFTTFERSEHVQPEQIMFKMRREVLALLFRIKKFWAAHQYLTQTNQHLHI